MAAFDGPMGYATLSAMITPALMMTATGSFIISTSNRMGRVVDRIRALNDLSDSISRGVTDIDFRADRLAHVDDQLDCMDSRSSLIRYALGMLYLGEGMFVATSLALALDVQLGHRIDFLPATFAVVGTLSLLGACSNLFREAREALSSNRQEVDFYRGLQRRRKAAGEGEGGARALATPG